MARTLPPNRLSQWGHLPAGSRERLHLPSLPLPPRCVLTGGPLKPPPWAGVLSPPSADPTPPPGLTGPGCEVNPDDCVRHQCQNGGTCQDGMGTYTCLCSEAWTGESFKPSSWHRWPSQSDPDLPSHRTPSRRPGPLEISFPSHSSPPHPARSPGSQPSRLRSLKPSLGSGPGRPRPPPSLPPERGGGSLPWKNVLVCPPVWLRDQSRVSATKKGFRKERAARSWPGSCRHCCAPKTRVS